MYPDTTQYKVQKSKFGFLQVSFCDDSCNGHKVQHVWTISYIIYKAVGISAAGAA